ncbi:MAG: YraN family protein [Gammaproteobacteria bacterium]|nr:YraN family protein [Gammaproteobacteria bacterium]
MTAPKPAPANDTARMALGRRAEQLAVEHLERHGAEILLRNFRRRSGELDVVARWRNMLLVVEVRLRSRRDFGGSAASVDIGKQHRIIRTTRQLLQCHPALARWPLRFDVIAVEADPHGEWQLEWIAHAFSASD